MAYIKQKLINTKKLANPDPCLSLLPKLLLQSFGQNFVLRSTVQPHVYFPPVTSSSSVQNAFFPNLVFLSFLDIRFHSLSKGCGRKGFEHRGNLNLVCWFCSLLRFIFLRERKCISIKFNFAFLGELPRDFQPLNWCWSASTKWALHSVNGLSHSCIVSCSISQKSLSKISVAVSDFCIMKKVPLS